MVPYGERLDPSLRRGDDNGTNVPNLAHPLLSVASDRKTHRHRQVRHHMRGELAARPPVTSPAGRDRPVDHIPRYRGHQHAQRHLNRTNHHTRAHGRRSHLRQQGSCSHAARSAHYMINLRYAVLDPGGAPRQ